MNLNRNFIHTKFNNRQEWILPLVLSFITGCTTNFNGANSLNTTGVTAGTPTLGTTNSGSFILGRVVKNALNPTTTFDLIGDGTNSFGTYCQVASGDPTSTTGATVCNCQYKYSSPTAPNQMIEVPVNYREPNLLRCPYAGLPADVTSVNVAVHVTSSNLYSNSVTFNFKGGNATLDTSSINTYRQTYRYGCPDTVQVQGILDGSVYDPFQSEDHHLAYPLSFYTANLGNALAMYSTNSKGSGWNCLGVLNPDDVLTNASTYKSTNHVNVEIFSQAALPSLAATGASDRERKRIYPPPTTAAARAVPGSDRSTFYLAKQATGVFNIPINAYIAPNTLSDATNLLGYGAAPVPTSVGETCPATPSAANPNVGTPIPTGYHWVKVWLFRSSLPERFAVGPGSNGLTIADLGSISCNPGDWLDSAAASVDDKKKPVFPTCEKDHTVQSTGTTGNGMSLKDVDARTVHHYLADRYLGSGECIQLSWSYVADNAGNPLICDVFNTANPAAPPATYDRVAPGPQCNTSIARDNAVYKWGPNGDLGADLWYLLPSNWDLSKTPNNTASCPQFSNATYKGFDPVGICTQTTTGRVRSVSPINTNVAPISIDKSVARYDFVFVVTPSTVMVNDMLNPQSALRSYYWPYRFLTDTDCPSPADPDGCSTGVKAGTYALKLHDVSTNGDPPANDPNRAGIFPVCALQPDP